MEDSTYKIFAIAVSSVILIGLWAFGVPFEGIVICLLCAIWIDVTTPPFPPEGD